MTTSGPAFFFTFIDIREIGERRKKITHQQQQQQQQNTQHHDMQIHTFTHVQNYEI
jgi:hypothetical protein